MKNDIDHSEEQEIFWVKYNYKGTHYDAEIRTQWPEGMDPPNATYEVWINGEHQFTIEHSLDDCYMPCWQSLDGTVDKFLAEIVGEAIERHFA